MRQSQWGRRIRKKTDRRVWSGMSTCRSWDKMGSCWIVLTRGGCDLMYFQPWHFNKITDFRVENTSLSHRGRRLKPVRELECYTGKGWWWLGPGKQQRGEANGGQVLYLFLRRGDKIHWHVRCRVWEEPKLTPEALPIKMKLPWYGRKNSLPFILLSSRLRLPVMKDRVTREKQTCLLACVLMHMWEKQRESE